VIKALNTNRNLWKSKNRKTIEEPIHVEVQCYKMGPKSSQTLKRSNEAKKKKRTKRRTKKKKELK